MDYYAISSERDSSEVASHANSLSATAQDTYGCSTGLVPHQFQGTATNSFQALSADYPVGTSPEPHSPSSPSSYTTTTTTLIPSLATSYFPAIMNQALGTPSQQWSPAGAYNLNSGGTQYFGCAGTEYVDPHAAQINVSDYGPAATHHVQVQYHPDSEIQQVLSHSVSLVVAAESYPPDIPLYAPVPLSAYAALLSGSTSTSGSTLSNQTESDTSSVGIPSDSMRAGVRGRLVMPLGGDDEDDDMSLPVRLSQAPLRYSAGGSRSPSPLSSSITPTPETSVVAQHEPMKGEEQQRHQRQIKKENSPLEFYLSAPQVMLPTPCELLTDSLSSRGRVTGNGTTATAGVPGGHPSPTATDTSASDHSQSVSGTTSGPHLSQDDSPCSSPSTVASGIAAASSSASSSRKMQHGAPARSGKSKSLKQSANQRKTYFGLVAENVGFQPTDP